MTPCIETRTTTAPILRTHARVHSSIRPAHARPSRPRARPVARFDLTLVLVARPRRPRRPRRRHVSDGVAIDEPPIDRGDARGDARVRLLLRRSRRRAHERGLFVHVQSARAFVRAPRLATRTRRGRRPAVDGAARAAATPSTLCARSRRTRTRRERETTTSSWIWTRRRRRRRAKSGGDRRSSVRVDPPRDARTVRSLGRATRVGGRRDDVRRRDDADDGGGRSSGARGAGGGAGAGADAPVEEKTSFALKLESFDASQKSKSSRRCGRHRSRPGRRRSSSRARPRC